MAGRPKASPAARERVMRLIAIRRFIFASSPRRLL